MNMIPEGIIEVDSDFGRAIGFTSDKFHKGSYLFWKDGELWISAVVSKVKGAFREMMKKVEALGLDFCIPTPFPRMMEIGAKQGWKYTKRKVDKETIDCFLNKRVVA